MKKMACACAAIALASGALWYAMGERMAAQQAACIVRRRRSP